MSLAAWTEARFGMFVHWGLYALPARGEWVLQQERMTAEAYRPYFERFDPDLFDPRAWARTARAAGMRYLVLTTKHHDGFCLWDSDLTDYKVTRTPWGRDLVGPVVEACRAEGLLVGFYHSLLDWHHPDFPVDGLHPQRDDEAFRAATAGRDVRRYADYLHGQVRELLTRYGRVDLLFFDFSYANLPRGGKGPDAWRSEELLALVRELQPDAVVNDRLGIPGDYATPEQLLPPAPVERDGRRVPWETNHTLNDHWGYAREDRAHKSPDRVVRMLADCVSKGGNLLLNVGPTGRGRIDPASERALAEVGEWMALHERSIRGCGPADLAAPPDCRLTRRGDRLYVHVHAWTTHQLRLPGLAGRVAWAQLLHDASEVRVRDGEDGTAMLELPEVPPPVLVPVVELLLR